MNRWFQATLAFVLTVSAINGVFGKDSKQLTVSESQLVIGSLWTCTPVGTCECAALPGGLSGGSGNPCSGGCTPAGNCRKCDGAGTYRECRWLFWGTCTSATTTCGDQWDGGVCGPAPSRSCKIDGGPPCINVGACNESQCNM